MMARSETDDRGGALARKIELFLPLSDEEREALLEIEREVITFDRGKSIVRVHESFSAVYVIQDGWAMRSKWLADGRRHISNFLLPGDFIGNEAIVFRRSDHTVTALMPLRASPVEISALLNRLAAFPRLAFAIACLRARDEALLLERLLSLGRRTAYERTAHLLIELWTRLKLMNIAPDDGIEIPATQEHLADCLGISAVHMSRVLHGLQQDGLIYMELGPPKRIVIIDIDRLHAAAVFDSRYLHFDNVVEPWGTDLLPVNG